MQIVGAQQVIASDGYLENLIRFYRGLFDRLTKEVKNTGNQTRYIGYQSIINENVRLCLLGIEVDSIEGIPEGMAAWDLSDSTWNVWQTKKGQDVLVSQKDITWQWIDKSPAGNGRCTGEFTASSPSELIAGKNSQYRNFWISANAYVGLLEKDTSSDEVHLVDYDPSWPQRFDEFASWLREHLGPEIVLQVSHYGSTAIPGMPAKPIIDILVQIPSFSQAKKHIIPLLNSEQWEYWWYWDHMVFIKRNKLMGQRTHNIHMVPQGHKLWEGVVFRDYLISHDEDALRYAILKQELAASYREDRERYTEAKTMFVKEITSKALGCS
ncbi:MAG: GrpB family protein [Planctomycetota bacterium]